MFSFRLAIIILKRLHFYVPTYSYQYLVKALRELMISAVHFCYNNDILHIVGEFKKKQYEYIYAFQVRMNLVVLGLEGRGKTAFVIKYRITLYDKLRNVLFT